MSATTAPTMDEMKRFLADAKVCLTCDANACGTSGDPCFEFTPEGVTVCAQLPWWNGQPVTRATLLEWNDLVMRFEVASRGD